MLQLTIFCSSTCIFGKKGKIKTSKGSRQSPVRFRGKRQFAASNGKFSNMPAKRGAFMWICTGLVVFLLMPEVRGQHTRRSRDILQLAKVMSCTTGKNVLQITWSYLNYGCWCGVRGAGKPVDGTDWCCMKHDQCYERLNSQCQFFHLYVTRYSFQCTSRQQVQCTTEILGSKCKYLLCECDRQFANCISYQTDYSPRYRHYRQHNRCN
ncbi:basic phospholipase A2 RVV-VD-like [Heptranchias perlo]|uniref:basic phospholipase A2 RVV-VD-like n=1 Tax=Heptranchias perlo TaxID=212740 RepID=UPI00355A1A25